MICNIVAGSPDTNIEPIRLYDADCMIGVDYGAYLLVKHNLKLDIAVGDFDSIGTRQFLEVINHCEKVYRYESQKAKTDTELAIDRAIELGYNQINLFGATGRRLDHFLGTLNLFQQAIDQDIDLTIIDEHNRIYVLKPGEHVLKKNAYKYISLFSYGAEVKNLTLKGFKYELDAYNLQNVDSLCVSNEINEEQAKISFTQGICLIVESND